ncbi:enoyl-CoA hydratase/isomerase family protein [Rhodococcus pyridinivorans]|uniref:Enoyl-CoA hydratase/isomerase family protein n=1 Tax=Rhodococcus pyridinivorans TaxID=103816 RepID=A0A7M2XK67_9NOCA|nr:enoyl-CoA hydratase/isomerase family protein [Rhodococcus pyridinivorans]QOV98256.1 enoyl-CoA hydratase/isomerase family protein [Rhodococcus pyridinivorans]WMM72146.1 enoyl-CoA hydratase/isomerase family protein [Rhodococcus pyridinivorans]
MDTARAVTLSAADLANGGAGEPLLGDGGAVNRPMVVVDLDEHIPDIERAVERAALADRILVGRATREIPAEVGPLIDALDVTYAPVASSRGVVDTPDPDASIAEFAEAVSRNPQAALVARQVVCASETLAVPEAIDVESFAYSTLQGGPEFAAWLTERGPRPLPPPSDEPVLIARDGDDLHITLNRPERRNAYGTVLRDALVDALRLALVDDSVERVVLDGAGSSFCAGGDLDEFGRTPDITLAHFIRTRGGAGRLVAELADRMEVRVHGHCIGAGIEIPAFAGRVVAASGTVFRLPEVSMGLIPGAGGTVSIPRRIGRWRSLHLFVTAAPLDASRALDWGLVDEIREG